MSDGNKKLLEITLVPVSDSTFNVEIYEPETGEFKLIKCHDNGASVDAENQQITDEIRSWVSMMRDESDAFEDELNLDGSH